MRFAALFLSLLLPLSAQNFRTQRRVHPTGKGPQRLEVDMLLLGACRSDLGDLRLKDAANREIPYVLVPPVPGEPSWKVARLLPLPKTKESSGFEMDLGSAMGTSCMKVEGLRAPFLKRFRLEGSGDRQRWTELVKEGSLFDLPGESLRLLQVDFPYGEYRYLRLTWDDRSSACMTLPRTASIKVEGSGRSFPPQESVGFEARPSEPGHSRFRVRLPGPHLPMRALVLEVAGQGPLLREARIFESRFEAGNMTPRNLGQGILRRAEQGGVLAADFRIPIDAPEGVDLDLKVDDGNNAPLNLKGLKAELEPQPWIYFESPDGGAITACYGDEKLAAPKYDLEAMKEQLHAAKVSRAQWAAPQPALAEVARYSASLDPGPGALLEQIAFRFHRAVPDAPAGMAALVLDAHVLANSPRLADLRILNQENRQVPYVLERRDEPLVANVALSKPQIKGKTSVYTLTLPQTKLPGARLILKTESRVFERVIRLRAELEQGQVHTLLESLWKHGDPESAAPSLSLALPSLENRQLSLEVDEGDNQPLIIQGVQLLLPTWRLRFFHPGKDLRLCYGCALDEPRYDLALLASRLRLEPAQELVLGSEGATPQTEHSPMLTKLFWAVLVLAVVALLLILMRLLKQPEKMETKS